MQWNSRSRPPLPGDPPARAGCGAGEGLCNRFLWHQDPSRSLARASRKLRCSSRRFGCERSQCFALPAEQLLASPGGCRMKRYVSGLNQASASPGDGLANGLFLVRVERIQYRWHRQKPFYAIQFSVVEPTAVAGNRLAARLSCSSKNLWKLNWFLRDFGYDPELLERNEIDDKRMVGLCGVVKISQSVINGTTVVDFDGFAP